jgi:hypothetical protein
MAMEALRQDLRRNVYLLDSPAWRMDELAATEKRVYAAEPHPMLGRLGVIEMAL